jgi:hypothetical protein
MMEAMKEDEVWEQDWKVAIPCYTYNLRQTACREKSPSRGHRQCYMLQVEVTEYADRAMRM